MFRGVVAVFIGVVVWVLRAGGSWYGVVLYTVYGDSGCVRGVSVRSRGGGQLTGGALVLCTHVLFAMNVDFCSAHLVLTGLKMSSCNICGIVKNFISVFCVIATAVARTIDHFLAFRLNEGSPGGLRRAFSASLGVLLLLTLLMILLDRAVNL